MKNSDRDRFDGRLKTASEAKQNRLEHFKAAVNDPERLKKRAKRDEVAALREAARQAKAVKKLQEKEALEQLQTEQALRDEAEAEAQRAADAAEVTRTADEVAAQTLAREAERKAERDRRYAARRNRKR